MQTHPTFLDMGASRSELDSALAAVAIAGIAETATHELLRAQIKQGEVGDFPDS